MILFIYKQSIDFLKHSQSMHPAFSVTNQYLSPSCYDPGDVVNLKSVIEAEFSVGLFTRSKSDFNFQDLFYLPA